MKIRISKIEGYHWKHTYVYIFQENKNVYLYMFPSPKTPLSFDTLLISCSVPSEIKFILSGIYKRVTR